MSVFRVSFYNELVGSQGQVHKVCQRSIDVRSARSIDRAVAAAKRKFESEERVSFWGHRARSFEVERIKSAAALSEARHIATSAGGAAAMQEPSLAE